MRDTLAERGKAGEDRQALLDDLLIADPAVADPAVADEDVGGLIRGERIGWPRIRAALAQPVPRLPRDHGHLGALDVSSYGYLRQFTPQILAAMEFASGTAAAELLAAVAILHALNTSGARRVPADAPTGFVPTRWRGYLAGIAATLGADVPSQIDPVTCLVEGVGQKLTTLPVAADHWIVLLPGGGGLSTAEVFAEADRIGIGRSQEELDEIAGRLWAVASNAVSPLAYPALLVNDLERPAISLRPEIGSAMQAMEEAGAGFVAMTGSGPTVFGIFADAQTAADAAASLGDEAILCQGGIGL